MPAYIGPITLQDTQKKTEKTAPQILTSALFESRIQQNIFPLNYACIRKLRKDPTIQLARWAVLSPMLHTPWTYVAQRKNATEEMIEAVETAMAPYRDFLLQQAVFGTLDFGWQPFEVIYKPEEGKITFENFKALLQDYTDILVYVNTGQFAGFVNEPVAITDNSSQIVEEPYALCTNFSVEGTDWYGYSVFSSLEDTLKSWTTVEETATRYDKKIAGAAWVVYYPVGITKFNGTDTPNDQIARRILANLEASGGVAMPDEIQGWLDPIERDAKGKWRVELISSNSSTQSSFIDRQKYLDALKMRAFGLTERSVLEGTHGTKAEADVHGDVSLSIIHAKHKLMCNQITIGPIAQFMRWNYGEKYKDSVALQPAPLVDSQFATVKEIYRLIMQNPETLYKVVERLDLNAMETELGIPGTDTPQVKIERKEEQNGIRRSSESGSNVGN